MSFISKRLILPDFVGFETRPDTRRVNWPLLKQRLLTGELWCLDPTADLERVVAMLGFGSLPMILASSGPTVVPGSQTLTSSGSHTVQIHNTYVRKGWGGGGGGGATGGSGSTSGSNGGQTSIAASDVTMTMPGGNRGARGISGGDGAGGSGASAGTNGDTNTAGNAGTTGNSTNSGAGGSAPGGGGAGGSAVSGLANGNNGSPPGGGGGGAHATISGGTSGGGGGSGAYGIKTTSAGVLIPGASITVTIGTGGSGDGSTTTGGDGARGEAQFSWS